MNKTVPQSVFDSIEARKVAERGHAEACAELESMPRHALNENNPNHPRFDLHLFGVHYKVFLQRQYK